jgi:hypothetical protein
MMMGARNDTINFDENNSEVKELYKNPFHDEDGLEDEALDMDDIDDTHVIDMSDDQAVQADASAIIIQNFSEFSTLVGKLISSQVAGTRDDQRGV